MNIKRNITFALESRKRMEMLYPEETQEVNNTVETKVADNQ